MGEYINWSEADIALDNIIYVLPDGTNEQYAEFLRRNGFPTATRNAVRKHLNRRNLSAPLDRVHAMSADRHETMIEHERPDLVDFVTDKKEGYVDWRELAHHMTALQELREKASWSQDESNFGFPNARKSIQVVFLADWHLSNLGTDHKLAEQITDQIMSYPDLYIAVLGDMTEMAIRLRNVQETQEQGLDAEMQMQFMESWLAYLAPRIFLSTWDNHAVAREEEQSGTSTYQRIWSRRVIYHEGIGHSNIRVGDEVYPFAISHKFRSRSRNNPCQGQMNYMRYDAQDREIAVAGDSHIPGVIRYKEGGIWRVGINTGSLVTNGKYAHRNYSLTTADDMPVIQLFAHKHQAIPYINLGEWADANGRR